MARRCGCNLPVTGLYEVARRICHDFGMDWYDPRSGKRYAAPKGSVPGIRRTKRKKKSPR